MAAEGRTDKDMVWLNKDARRNTLLVSILCIAIGALMIAIGEFVTIISGWTLIGFGIGGMLPAVIYPVKEAGG